LKYYLVKKILYIGEKIQILSHKINKENMDKITQSSQTYYSSEGLILDYIEKLNQGFAVQFTDYLKDINSDDEEKKNERDEEK